MSPTPPHPQIDYPCQWEYTLIGLSEELIREAVREVLGAAEHTLTLSHTSRTGKYVSLRLQTAVADEAHRLALFRALAAHRHVKTLL